MTGSLQIKNNKYYAVLNLTGTDGKRRQKWISTDLDVRGNKKRALKMLELFKGTEIEAVVSFIATYGIRRSEALGLCWDKVDFNNNQFTIAKAMIQCNKTGFYLKDCTKNDSSYRTLPFTKHIRSMLENLQKKRAENSKIFGDTYHMNDFVFTWSDGSPITPNYLTRTFHKIISASDLPPVRLHDLRHSTASNLLANGFSVVEVQHWLGHSQASTTLNFYSHIDSSSKENIKNALEDLIPLEKC